MKRAVSILAAAPALAEPFVLLIHEAPDRIAPRNETDAAGMAYWRACADFGKEAAAAGVTRRRIMVEGAHSVLGAKACKILMDEGLRPLITQGRVARIDPEALAQMLNGTISNLAWWVATAPPGDDHLPRAHQTLAMVLDGMEVKRP